ncbi:FAD binding domain-containing protein [Colletotrichum orchidophilum]|uniref:FAD binding domain-containing protein n=1 Tax=Colletotrichum orchidophilum TaxID=1209926 RepID=A0A1G4AYV3_9PEZI|nr:FAD binding domain-containing protein [Colletotrichum orchidophilum]OHE94296.1 FAD binding domain-containing protein [Colletotrichum orchidophilum]
MTPFFAPNKTADKVTTLLDPWFSKLRGLGIPFDPNITEYDRFYPAWKVLFPLEAVEKLNIQNGSCLVPRRNFESEALKQAVFDAIRTSLETSHVFVGLNIKATSPDDPANAVNPAWRENILFALQSARCKYPRLLELKDKWDPEDVFFAATAVCNEFWKVITAYELPHENGRLCRVDE